MSEIIGGNMKRSKTILAVLGLSALLIGGANKQNFLPTVYAMEEVTPVSADSTLQISAKSAYLMDFSTKTCLFSKEEDKRLPIASMCKIMTLLLAFEAIDAGALSFEEELMISERAASMGGSQVFLEANAKYPVKELIKSIVVCSANDSCVAMAEKIAGSEELFVEKMNARAMALGANNTLFANCTGLPKQPQYSCAKDVALMLKELLNHKEYYEFGKVWMDKFQHPEGRYTEISNTNKLVRFYDGCDGGKTGFTNEAGFCLAATAKRDNTRVISVVIGEENSATRFEDVKTMFNYAFANYETKPIVRKGESLEASATVFQGKQKQVLATPARDIWSFNKRGEKNNVTFETKFEKIKAPVKKGDKIGEMIVYTNGVETDKVDLLAFEKVDKATVWDSLQEIAQEWNG